VVIDAIGVEQSQKTDSRPLEKAPSVSLKEVLQRIAVGDRSEEMLSTLANRLLRLDKQINPQEKISFVEKAHGKLIQQVVRQLLNAHDPDRVEEIERDIRRKNPEASPAELETKVKEEHKKMLEEAVNVFHNPELREFIVDVRKKYDQVIDNINIDTVTGSGWVKDIKISAEQVVTEFKQWINDHKDEITALQIFYSQPYRRRDLTFRMIKELCDTILLNKPALAPLRVWQAYEQLESVSGQPKNEMIALVSLIRKVAEIDENLTSFDRTVDENFKKWVFKKNAGQHNRFTEEQMAWLRMMKDHIANSVHLSTDDLDYTPFDAMGGRGKMWQLFGEEMGPIIEELNEALTA
jgi:type I restriction enzyme R subunit